MGVLLRKSPCRKWHVENERPNRSGPGPNIVRPGEPIGKRLGLASIAHVLELTTSTLAF